MTAEWKGEQPMDVVRTIAELRDKLGLARYAGGSPRSVGFVPTMGYLHEGHKSLIQKAREADDVVVLSIFVNPLQFGPNEDFARYPRDAGRDLSIAQAAGVDIVFMPEVSEMYPEYPLATTVKAGAIADRYCGASRPGHFDGVATVVAKLFNIVQPDRAYFGLKDLQQVAVIEQMAKDLNFPVEIVPCPTVREADGLALSSRNVYLSAEERRQAQVLSKALKRAEQWLQEPGLDASELERRLRATIEEAPLAGIDYVAVAAYPSLTPLQGGIPIGKALAETGDGQIALLLAVNFGNTRLIDNRVFQMAEVTSRV